MLFYSSSIYKVTAEYYTQTHFLNDEHLFSETANSKPTGEQEIYFAIIASIIYKAATSTIKSDFHIIMQNTLNSFPFFLSQTLFMSSVGQECKRNTPWSQIAIPFATQCSFGRLFVILGFKFLANNHPQHFRGRKMFIILAKITNGWVRITYLISFFLF